MKIKLLAFFVLFSTFTFAQEYIFGKVVSESNTDIQEVLVLNLRTDEKALTDKHGNYMIGAKKYDELRFIKAGFDRIEVKISFQNYSEPLNVSLLKSPYLIPEVEIGFHVSGDLKKDLKNVEPSKKTIALNNAMSSYMMKPPTEVSPTLTTPSAFAQPNFSAAQLNVLGLGSAIASLIGKATQVPLTKANYAETQAFFREIKTSIDLSFYYKQGWDEEEIDRFLIYADKSYSLAKKYRDTFDVSSITSDMKLAYNEYIKTYKIGF
jgi:hypothetical protein